MRDFCTICNKEVEHHNWRMQAIEGRVYQICGLHFKPMQTEWIPDRIKRERREHLKDIIQPRRAGEPSKEFIDTYPEQAKRIFNKEDRRQARNVWSDLEGHREHFG